MSDVSLLCSPQCFGCVLICWSSGDADETGEVEQEVIVRVSRASDPPPAPGTAAAEAAAASAVAEEGTEEAASEAPWSMGKMPYLGGFRDKRSGVVYHHAASQTRTQRRKPWEGKPAKVSRDTQTPKAVTRSAQTKREAATQMERAGLSIGSHHDRVIAAQPYVSADEIEALRFDKVMLLQRCWRGYTARKAAGAIQAARASEQEERLGTAAAAAAAAAAEHRREVERRVKPRTKKDFAALYGEVEGWRQTETARIKGSDLSEEEKREALAQLLANQTKMLSTVDALRTRAAADAKQRGVLRKLEAMSEPQRWQTGDGSVAAVQTPFSQRAAELKALYEALLAKPSELVAGGEAAMPREEASLLAGGGASAEAKDADDTEGGGAAAAAAGAAGGKAAEARVRVLLQVKWTVKEFDCGLTREMVELIDREADLLARGRPAASLRSLRRRLANLFLQFVETPEFNPEAARFQPVPRALTSRPNVMPIAKA